MSVLVELPDTRDCRSIAIDGIGIDLGLKDLAIVSNGKTYKNINKSARVKETGKAIAQRAKMPLSQV